MSSDSNLFDLASRVGAHLLASRRALATAESCTGGWIGKVATDVAGSSAWYRGGVVVYSNALKQRLLKVDAAMLATQGAVSEAVVRAMAEGALAALDADIAVSVSGIAGPDGGSADKPVGTVWFAWSMKGKSPQTIAERHVFGGDREQVRRQTVALALERMLQL
jgi:nicotinamide-nucleotide amidase